MSITDFTWANGFQIQNTYYPEVCDSDDCDTILIEEDPQFPGKYLVKYSRKCAHSIYRGSWARAVGYYNKTHDYISGDIMVEPAPGGTNAVPGEFIITLDRDLCRLTKPRIHVRVKIKNPAPDEGSYTGDGK